MSKKINISHIVLTVLLIALSFGCKDSQKSTEKAVLQGLSIKYWTVEHAPKDAEWYVSIESKDGVLRRQPLGTLAEVSTVALQKQNDEYVLSVCDTKGSAISCRLGRDITYLPLLTFHPGKSLSQDIFIFKGGEKEVTQDYSRLAQGENGVRLKIGNQ